jgi:hypothetical protein
VGKRLTRQLVEVENNGSFLTIRNGALIKAHALPGGKKERRLETIARAVDAARKKQTCGGKPVLSQFARKLLDALHSGDRKPGEVGA